MFNKKQREARIRIVKIDPKTDDAIEEEARPTIDPEQLNNIAKDFVTHNVIAAKGVMTHAAKLVGTVVAGTIVLTTASAIIIEKNKHHS